MFYNEKNQNEKRFFDNIYRTFYSICRNVTEFNEVDIPKARIYIKILEKRRKKDGNNMIYYKTLKNLKDFLIKKEINPEEAIYILINSIDQKLKIYEIYEEFCNFNDIEKECIKKLGFYDEKLIKFEKMYINKFCKSDNFDFTKKLTMK